MQTIFTKYLPASRVRGSRIKVWASGRKDSKTYSFDHAAVDPHRAAAEQYLNMLATTYGDSWRGVWAEGSYDKGSVYVFVSNSHGFKADTITI
jgi:hypothetical protein